MSKDKSWKKPPGMIELEQARRVKIFEEDIHNRLWDRVDCERANLKDEKYIDIHLITGEILVCELIEWGMYWVVVNFVDKQERVIKAIIPKHSIKFVVIKKSTAA